MTPFSLFAQAAQASPLPFWSDPLFTKALIGCLTAAAAWFGRGFMERKRNGAKPGAANGDHHVGRIKHLEDDVQDLGEGLKELHGQVEKVDDKLDKATVQVAELARDMEWVKDTVKAIGRKLGVV